MLRKPLYRLLDMPLQKAWGLLMDKLGDLKPEDVEPGVAHYSVDATPPSVGGPAFELDRFFTPFGLAVCPFLHT